MIKEAIPRISRVAVLWDAQGRFELPALARVAQSLSIQLQLVELRPPYDLATTFQVVKRQGADAILVVPSPQNYVHGASLAAQALAIGLPVIAET